MALTVVLAGPLLWNLVSVLNTAPTQTIIDTGSRFGDCFRFADQHLYVLLPRGTLGLVALDNANYVDASVWRNKKRTWMGPSWLNTGEHFILRMWVVVKHGWHWRNCCYLPVHVVQTLTIFYNTLLQSSACYPAMQDEANVPNRNERTFQKQFA